MNLTDTPTTVPDPCTVMLLNGLPHRECGDSGTYAGEELLYLAVGGRLPHKGSVDLGEAVALYEAGHTIADVAATLHVAPRTVVRNFDKACWPAIRHISRLDRRDLMNGQVALVHRTHPYGRPPQLAGLFHRDANSYSG